MGNSWESAYQMAAHAERTKAETMHRGNACMCARGSGFSSFGAVGKHGRGAWGGQGEGVVWAGAGLEVKVPLGVRLGSGRRRGRTYWLAQEALRLLVFACEALWTHADVMANAASAGLVNRLQKHHLSLQDRKSADSSCSFTLQMFGCL